MTHPIGSHFDEHLSLTNSSCQCRRKRIPNGKTYECLQSYAACAFTTRAAKLLQSYVGFLCRIAVSKLKNVLNINVKSQLLADFVQKCLYIKGRVNFTGDCMCY